MKKSKFILLTAIFSLIAVVCAGSVCAFADTQTETEERLPDIIVIGCADVRAEADECIMSGCIEAVANDMNSAEKKCSEILVKVREAFQPYGEVNENRYGVFPMYQSGGYTATRCLTFTTDKTDKLSEIREVLAAAGVCSLDGVMFRMKDDSQLKQRALQLAVEDAKAKAAALGTEGNPVRIEEISCHPSYRNCYEGEAPSNSVTYTACVRAVFAKRPKKNHETKDNQQPAEQNAENNC